MAGECTACTAVKWAAVGSVLGCSSTTTSKFTAGTCATGYFEVSSTAATCTDTCAACTAVANSKTDTALTCSSATTSRVVACADGFWKDGTGEADSDGVVNRVQVTAPTATADTVCTPCEAGLFNVGNADCAPHETCGCQSHKLKRAAATAGTPTADTVCDACINAFGLNTGDCTACNSVAGAASDATLTCTKVGDTRVSACAACDTTVKTVGGANTDDTCTETCGTGFYSGTDMCKAHTVC